MQQDLLSTTSQETHPLKNDQKKISKNCNDDGYCSSSSTPKSSGQLSTTETPPEKVTCELLSDGAPCTTLQGDPTDEDRSPKSTEERHTWSRKADFLLSIIGFAVDLANVWRFPYLCYRNGGGVFLIPYILMLVFGAMPLFYMELVLGQYNRQGPISVWKICPLFKGVGFCAVLISWYVSFYYNVIIGWTIYFMVSSMTSELPWIRCGNEWNTERCWGGLNGSTNISSLGNSTVVPNNRTSPALEFFDRGVLELHLSKGFDDLGAPKWQLVLCVFSVFVILYFALFKGVKSSGKVVWVTATAPYVILTILLFRGAFLPGAGQGVMYYLNPDVSKLLNSQVWVDAAVQVFFSVGVGFGVHLTYASYNNFHNNCYRDCLLTTAINSFTSFYSGFVIFIFLGYMAHKHDVPINTVATDGHGLVFQVYPEAIATLPGGQFWAVLFFIMLLSLGLDSAMGGLESVITGLMDEFRDFFERWKYSREVFTSFVLFTSFSMALINVTRGGGYTMHWFDNYSASISLLFSALFEAIGVAWLYGIGPFSENIREMIGHKPGIFWRLCWKFISPAFLIAVIGSAIFNNSPLKYQDYLYPTWAVALGWGFALSSVAMVPAVACYKLCKARGSCVERIAYTITPYPERKTYKETGTVTRFKLEHWANV
ncbi:sodium-dependent dopamine transporter-like isoform X1 [Stegodyphus dumicola]|uniref:sodium-dependent dopamine transporter-like isoform X1 n=1 Tax=Stegodyphus dumicola TaxID=202533 RepID=UPI0015B26E1D|nr:sodium-dependent dopamine transporter-like isoform X1 [Stegodyphus dumicola]XP_035213044.1 sodium-dependent dopamine transporter-like isoform X1 [Stegodyphus dumicola]XP_035213045.1 sodium-dependent dopamine transporter-like isoform X1 [Stegodyphus dumicola]